MTTRYGEGMTGRALFVFGLLAGELARASGVPGAAPADLERRLGAVRRLAERARAGSPEARAVAAELSDIGAAYLEQAETGRAIELLEEAWDWNPDDGLVLARLTLAYVRAEDYAFARFYLDLAREEAPRAPPETYAILGAIYYSVNRLEEAVLSWEQFERLGGADPSTLSRLARARAEMSLSRNQRLREIGDFVFSYDAALPPELVEGAAESLGAAARDLSLFFGASLPGRQSVILYEGRRYFALVSVPEWVSGAFDGKIRVTVDPDGGIAPELPMVLAHELAHAFVRRVSRDRAPGWLHEGLAQWWEGKRLLPRELRAALAGRTLSTLSEIEGSLSRQPDRAALRDAYVEALGLVEYLMLARGPGAVACLVRDLGQRATFEEALRAETGLSEGELLAAWKSWAGLEPR
jgi:tetratricopeptide (TPR) repeat protein